MTGSAPFLWQMGAIFEWAEEKSRTFGVLWCGRTGEDGLLVGTKDGRKGWKDVERVEGLGGRFEVLVGCLACGHCRSGFNH